MRVSRFAARENQMPSARVENICGVLVHCRPEDGALVTQKLENLPGVEVHGMSDDGKMVVTVEDAGGTWAGATIEQFNKIKGVLSVALVYHHFDSELQGEIVP